MIQHCSLNCGVEDGGYYFSFAARVLLESQVCSCEATVLPYAVTRYGKLFYALFWSRLGEQKAYIK